MTNYVRSCYPPKVKPQWLHSCCVHVEKKCRRCYFSFIILCSCVSFTVCVGVFFSNRESCVSAAVWLNRDQPAAVVVSSLLTGCVRTQDVKCSDRKPAAILSVLTGGGEPITSSLNPWMTDKIISHRTGILGFTVLGQETLGEGLKSVFLWVGPTVVLPPW